MNQVTLLPGDCFILLYSQDPAENRSLAGRQADLQNALGGWAVTPVHLTLQKFRLAEPARMAMLAGALQTGLGAFPPFRVTAISARPMFSPFSQEHILKWEISLSEALVRACTLTERILAGQGGASLYAPGWIPTLVTALRGLPGGELNGQLKGVTFPQFLFTANTVSISRLLHPGQGHPDDFETLATFSFPNPTA